MPNHPNYGYDHAQNHMKIKTIFSKEKASHDQHKDRLYMTAANPSASKINQIHFTMSSKQQE
jgi:hypothetical protein